MGGLSICGLVTGACHRPVLNVTFSSLNLYASLLLPLQAAALSTEGTFMPSSSADDTVRTFSSVKIAISSQVLSQTGVGVQHCLSWWEDAISGWRGRSWAGLQSLCSSHWSSNFCLVFLPTSGTPVFVLSPVYLSGLVCLYSLVETLFANHSKVFVICSGILSKFLFCLLCKCFHTFFALWLDSVLTPSESFLKKCLFH